eukprot:3919508-Pleurochrysis_carterae.AAC.1
MFQNVSSLGQLNVCNVILHRPAFSTLVYPRQHAGLLHGTLADGVGCGDARARFFSRLLYAMLYAPSSTFSPLTRLSEIELVE